MNARRTINRRWSAGVQAEDVGPAAGRAHATDVAGRPAPNSQILREADEYNVEHGFPPINHGEYIAVDPTRARRIADAYEALPMDDSADPTVWQSYEALAKEVNVQWTFAVAHGMTFEPAPSGTDPYKTSFNAAKDVRENRHLYFYQGGEPHGFLSAVDPHTGYSINDKFRAIHDYFGHCAAGYGFGPRGEENAWNVHSQMFSWGARRALTTETRGQNSWVNFGPQNYSESGRHRDIPPAERPYALQKTALLPDEFVQRPALPRDQSVISPRRTWRARWSPASLDSGHEPEGRCQRWPKGDSPGARRWRVRRGASGRGRTPGGSARTSGTGIEGAS